MITKANIVGKPVIVAAQMLESMVDTPRPTRAEMTDVANAAYDGADAILLRTETANGQFVDKVVATAAAILRDAEVGGSRQRASYPALGSSSSVMHCSMKGQVQSHPSGVLPALKGSSASGTHRSVLTATRTTTSSVTLHPR